MAPSAWRGGPGFPASHDPMALWRAIFEEAAIGIALVDRGCRIVATNRAMEDMLGFSAEELRGMSIRRIAHPDHVDAIWSRFRALLNGEQDSCAIEERCIRKDGNDVWARFRASLIRTGSGQPLYAVGMAEDVTRERQATVAAGRLASAVEAVSEGVAICDREGRFIYLNRAEAMLFGYDDPNELLGLPWTVLYEPAEAEQLETITRTELPVTGTWRGEVVGRAKDGSQVPHEISLTLLESGDLICIDRSTAERRESDERLRRSEEQLHHAQKMEAVGQLVAGMAHDFNNLLTVVSGNAMLLQRGELDSEAALPVVISAAERGAALIRQLLAFSREQIRQPQIVRLDRIVGEVQQLVRVMVGERIEVVLDLDSSVGPVEADPVQIEQLILNLAANARDAMPTGGRLEISLAETELDDKHTEEFGREVDPGRYVVLAVTDTGEGIPESVVGRIFDPFFTTKPKGKGTGLGLSSVSGIVEQCGGYVSVDTEIGRGTTFRIYLPRRAEAEEPKVVPVGGHPESYGDHPESLTVLVVDDDAAVRRLIVSILRRRGYEVLEAEDAESALEISRRRSEPLHLLLADLTLPGADGHELATRIKAGRPEARVLHVSGRTRSEAEHHGAVDPGGIYVQKPFTPDELADKVREAIAVPERP